MMLELGMMLQPVKNLQKSPKKVGMQQLAEEMHQQHLLLEGEGLEEETPKTETE